MSDLAGSRELVYEVVSIAEPAQIEPLVGRLAAAAGKANLALASEMYDVFLDIFRTSEFGLRAMLRRAYASIGLLLGGC